MHVSLDQSVKLNCAFQSGNPPFLRTRRLKSKISAGKQAVFPDNLDFRLILLRQVTPARYTSLAGCDSTLRRARPNGSSSVGRHQPEMSESPTIYVRITDIFGHLDIWGDKLSAQTQGWTFRVIERQQSSARTALWPSRPECLICSRRRSYIPATVPRVSSVV